MKNKLKSFSTEFKEFISRGNVVDMAVGVVVGTAFTGIVNSLVKDVIMPFVGWLIGGIDFSRFMIVLPAMSNGEESSAIMYGNFVNQIVNFLILAFVVFLFIKLLGKFKHKKEEAPAPEPTPSEEVLLLSEIRDLLKK